MSESSSHPEGRRTPKGSTFARGMAGVAVLLWVLVLLQPWNADALAVLHGELPKPGHAASAVMTYQRWGFIGAALTFSLAAALANWRLAWQQLPPVDKDSTRTGGGRVWLGLVLLVLMLATRIPLLPRDITRDEQHDQATAVQGAWLAHARPSARPPLFDTGRSAPVQSDGDPPVWQPVTWTQTLNECATGSNSPPSSLLVRLCHRGWQALSGSNPQTVNVVAMRAPALILAALAVFLLWRTASALGGVWAGAVAAGWLLLHPLFVSESVEARCYTLVLCLELLALRGLIRALRGGASPADWLGLHLCCAGLIYAFPGSLYLVLCVEIASLWPLLRPSAVAPAKATFGPWLTGGLAALGVLLAVGLPSLVERWYAIRDHYPYPHAFGGWWLQVWHIHTAGFSWPQFDTPGLPRSGASWLAWPAFLARQGLGTHPWAASMALIIVPGLMLHGVLTLARRGQGRLLLLGLLPVVAAVLSLLHHVIFTGYLALYWYFIFALPGMAVLVAAGLNLVSDGGLPRLPFRMAALAFLAAFAAISWPNERPGRLAIQRTEKRHFVSYQQGREYWVSMPDGRLVRYLPVPGR